MSDSVRITVTADGSQAQRAFRDVNRAMDGLRARAATTAAGVRILDSAVEGLNRSLTTLRGRTAAADNALRDFRTAGMGASTSMRTLITRLDAADSRLGDLSGRTTTLRRDMDDLGGSIDGVNGGLGDLRGDLRGLAVAGDSASSALGGGGGGGAAGGGGLAGSLAGVGAVLGASVLPSIGALSPMLFGLAGVGGAAALAMDGMKKQAKELKGPLDDWRKAAEKVVLPRTAKAVDTLKGAMKDLTPVIKTGGKAFGEIAESAAKFADSPAFKSALIKNVEMGSEFVKDFADNMGAFTQSFLDFGTKSQPTVDALQNLVGGALGRGMPSMFKELEQGIDGSADVVDGLAYLVNDSLLPSLGKVAGSFADSFGPLTKEMLTTAGDQVSRLATLFDGAAEALEPLANVGADAFRAFNELAAIGTSVAGSFAKEVGGALFESLTAVAGVDVSELDDGFRGLSDWVKDNQGGIRSAMLGVAQSITSMVTAGVEALPKLFSAFELVAEGILLGVDGLVSTLAGTFGNLPVIGDTFKEWNTSFDEVAGGFRDNMADIGGSIDSLVDEAVPRLNRAQITMSVDQAEASLEHIKQQLKDPELTKERKAKLTADKQDAEDELAAAKRELAAFDKAKAKAELDADSGPFADAMRWVKQQSIPKKTGMIVADTGGFWSGVRGIAGRVLGTSYINVQYRNVDSSASPTFRQADGGVMRFFADGGREQHVAQIAPAGSWRVWGEPETGGEAYIPLAQAKRPRSVAILSEVAEQFGYGLEQYARGGVTKAEREARKDARGDLTISHFGRRAGYKNTEFANALGSPGSLGELSSALNKWRSIIKKATHGGLENSLLKRLNSAGSALMKYEKQHDKLSKTLEKAKALRDDVSSGLKSEAGIVKSANASDSQVTINTLLSQMTGSAANTKQFSSMLTQLRKKGLSGDLVKQIATAGIEGGGMETAAAILGGGTAEIKKLNDLQKQIGSAAKSAGNAAADAMYGAGMKAGEGLIAGLEKQQKAIEKQMMKIAKAMEKSIKKALGIKSPSQVMMQVGDYTAEGFALGMRKNRSITPAWESMLNQPRTTMPAATGRAGGGRAPAPTVVLEIKSGGSKVDDLLVELLRKAVRNRGGDAQAVLGYGPPARR
ncbi:hypothetical protein [Streptomyces sp. 11x1]|uniref:hypothetical protein n=1 Tax=Streptomyces sp. 11x1 TaxID=3038642 RepID=UPI00292DED38|nr:hypothetical protein [Streptomyces sp. 11x1]WNZ11488.1 hypothetical protein P8T65_30680 [Streptomyces sp. 11x1]